MVGRPEGHAEPYPSRVKVVAIVGYTRSGSTLLDSILGQIPGFFSTGELHYIWERGLIDRRRCGCGVPIPECEVWSDVLERAFDDSPPDPRQVMRWQDGAVRTRHTWGLLKGGVRPVDRAALEAYLAVAGPLYGAIAGSTGARVIVDSSKRASDGAVLRLLDEIDPYVVHLVRDPRAVIHSWRRRKVELDSDQPSEMPRQGRARTAAEWSQSNIAADALRKRMGPGRSMLLRYEDLMRAPRTAVEAIARMVGEGDAALPFDDEHSVRLGPNHTVGGNPARFSAGATELRADDEWQRRMPAAARIGATALTAPLLPRYGYPVIGAGR